LSSATFLLTDLNLVLLPTIALYSCIVIWHMLDATNVWESPSMQMPWMALCSYRVCGFISPLVFFSRKILVLLLVVYLIIPKCEALFLRIYI
jgi:hypothetical protein